MPTPFSGKPLETAQPAWLRDHGPGPRVGPARRWSRRFLLVAVCAAGLSVAALLAVAPGRANRAVPDLSAFRDDDLPRTVPGEFEPQQAVLLAWPRAVGSPAPPIASDPFHSLDRMYCDIAAALWRTVRLVVLVEDAPTEAHVQRLLAEARVPARRVRLLRVRFESLWVRDFGPLATRAPDGSCTLIDAEYVDGPVSIYPHEDRLPARLGTLLHVRTLRAPITLHHGNLLCNGRGLCLATRQVLDENRGRGYDAQAVESVLRQCYGAQQVVFLDAMEGEPTGHVDMFATLPSHATVVIGQYDPEDDPVNAALLDHNARRLASVTVAGQPLKIVRIPMPRRVATPQGTPWWPTFTNVVYGNGVLLVPTFPGWDDKSHVQAMEVYRRELPGWNLVPINAVPALRWGGGVHCLALNLACLDQSTRTPNDQETDDGAGHD
jgi:agmatine/peptidylarginine deiminase